MKALLIIIVLAVLAATAATSANAARDPRVPALQRSVATLQAQVATLTAALRFEAATEQCNWAYQYKFNIATYNIFAIIFDVPQIADTVSDGGACAAVGKQPPRLLSSVGGLMLPAPSWR